MAKKKRTSNRIIYYLLGAVIFLVVLMIAGRAGGWIGQPKAIPVEVASVEQATIIEKVSASGTVQPVTEVKISPEVSGEILELSVEEGDSVTRGEFLLKIRPDNFISALERARANLNQMKANLANERAREARAQANFKRAELEYNRQKKLHEEKVISQADYEVAEANFAIAEQDLESAQQSVLAATYVVKSGEATVQEASENLRLTRITAPVSGIISKLNVEVGETVLGTSQMQGTEMLRIADLSEMEVRVDVNENDIIKIQLGDTSIIEVDSYVYMEKKFKGLVTQIANTANAKPSADAVTEFEVRIRILNSSYQDLVEERGLKYPFRPGMTASVEIITETRTDILTVPLAAVTTRKQEKESKKAGEKEEAEGEKEENKPQDQQEEEVEEVVFKLVDGKAVRTVVQTGISDFERIEVIGGLERGEKIISGPFLAVSKRLEDGAAVEATTQP